jgi:hypothetical protein
LLTTIILFVVAACAAQPRTVATDVQTLDKPVPASCRIAWPKKPTPHVANVQLTGNDARDAVLVWRAAEAELEELRAYKAQLEAAASKCLEPS